MGTLFINCLRKAGELCEHLQNERNKGGRERGQD